MKGDLAEILSISEIFSAWQSQQLRFLNRYKPRWCINLSPLKYSTVALLNKYFYLRYIILSQICNVALVMASDTYFSHFFYPVLRSRTQMVYSDPVLRSCTQIQSSDHVLRSRAQVMYSDHLLRSSTQIMYSVHVLRSSTQSCTQNMYLDQVLSHVLNYSKDFSINTRMSKLHTEVQ